MLNRKQLTLIQKFMLMILVLPTMIGVAGWSAVGSSLENLRGNLRGNASGSNSTPSFSGQSSAGFLPGTCQDQLPTIHWLGEGKKSYTLEAGFDTFIVKRLPFRFDLEAGTVNNAGERVYQATANERVWSCQGNCQLPAVHHEGYQIGDFGPGTRINLVVIDDDGLEQNNDQRKNWWAVNDPLTPYLVIDDQQMVEYLTLDLPSQGTWYYYANDSIGIAATCIEPSPPTATPTMTPTASATATVPPTATATASATPSATATATATDTATATPTATPTATETASATPTATLIPRVTTTPRVEPSMTITPTETLATPPPTALELLFFRANTSAAQVELQWESVLEMDLFGFQLWRSSNGERADAQLLTTQTIRSRGTATTGAAYRFTDTDVTIGVTYTYWLYRVNSDTTGADIDSTTAQPLHHYYLPLVGN